jgi:hypothetical protein
VGPACTSKRTVAWTQAMKQLFEGLETVLQDRQGTPLFAGLHHFGALADGIGNALQQGSPNCKATQIFLLRKGSQPPITSASTAPLASTKRRVRWRVISPI